jgi:hypothetical protein
MEIQLIAVSPITFEMVKEGELMRIERKPPNRNEYRDKIGPANECYLVVKGKTKIGMIPTSFVRQNPDLLSRMLCRIAKLDRANSNVVIAFQDTTTRQHGPQGGI